MLTAEQFSPFEALGVEIGAYFHHHHVDAAPRSVVLDQIRRPKAILEDLLGHPVASYAYPCGSYRLGLRARLRAGGYTSACAVRNAFSSVTDHPISLARLTVRDFATTETVRKRLHGRGAPIARNLEMLRTTVWRVRRWAAVDVARRPARGL